MYFLWENRKMILKRVIKLHNNEGLLSVIRRSLRYIFRNVFSYETYYLLKRTVQDVESKPKKKIDFVNELTTKSIKSNAQADEIAKEFEDFRPYYINAHRILDTGGIAYCLYVGKEVANIGWIAITEVAKKAMADIPMHVDFDNKEAYLGYSYTVPKYRRRGLRYYHMLLRHQTLKEMGIETRRAAIRTNNYASLIAAKDIPSRMVYAKARYLRFMGLRFWKEYPMNNTAQEIVDKMTG